MNVVILAGGSAAAAALPRLINPPGRWPRVAMRARLPYAGAGYRGSIGTH